MTAEPATESNSFGAAILDDDCNFRALSNGFRSAIGCPDDSASTMNQVFDHIPGMTDWIQTALTIGKATNFNGGSFNLQFLPLNIENDGSSDGSDPTTFFLIASSLTPPNGLNTERIRRIQHDIKNQLGGLKLYANFLKKRLADDAELIEIIDKMTSIVGAITQQVTQIRQEEGQ